MSDELLNMLEGCNTLHDMILELAYMYGDVPSEILLQVLEYSKEVRSRNIKKGIEEAANSGVVLGRPRGHSTRVKNAVTKYLNGEGTAVELSKRHRVGVETIRRVAKEVRETGYLE